MNDKAPITRSAASTVEPVAYVPLDGDKPMWSETHPRKLRDGDMALYAAPTTSPEPTQAQIVALAMDLVAAGESEYAASPEPDAVREKIARLISPAAFDVLASEKAWAIENGKPESWWQPFQTPVDAALAKADEVLALARQECGTHD